MSECTARLYESAGPNCDEKSVCEGGWPSTNTKCCDTNYGYCNVVHKGTDWEKTCGGSDFIRVAPSNCRYEVAVEENGQGTVVEFTGNAHLGPSPGYDKVESIRFTGLTDVTTATTTTTTDDATAVHSSMKELSILLSSQVIIY